MDLKKILRTVPDFPKPGINFIDITTLLQDRNAFKYAVNLMIKRYLGLEVDKIVGVESRGLILGGAMAYKLGCGFVPARKPGKLPFRSIREEYTLEYGTNTLEIHADAVTAGERVLVVDDLLATGGTALAVARMVEKLGGKVVGVDFLVELDFLHGRDKLRGYDVHSHIHF